MAEIQYWCFERNKAAAAAKDFAEELAAGEGATNPEAAQGYENLIRDFLHSDAARRHGLFKESGGES
jgi:hypothetical protein